MAISSVEKLYGISQKPNRRIIGLMSGTSLDGLDVACCLCSGSGRKTHISVEHFGSIPYSTKTKAQIRRVFAQPFVSFSALSELHVTLGMLHARMTLECLRAWDLSPQKVDIIASHGQTVFHSPKRQKNTMLNATFQIGDGDHIAYQTGIITVSDFRQKHIVSGGEGAPLTAYGDYFLFAKKNENRMFINIGGIANFTFLIGNRGIIVSDVGPGNTLMDGYMREQFGKTHDKDGATARNGRLLPALLSTLEADMFFKKSFPKTTGPEYFNVDFVARALRHADLSKALPQDVLCTLAHFTARAIGNVIRRQEQVIDHIYVSGGGVHNAYLMALLREQAQCVPMEDTSALGCPPDAKEAVLFALLANEAVAGKSKSTHPLEPAYCQ